MAELELSVPERQCLDRRLADRAAIEQVVAAWAARRTAATATIRRLYPAFEARQTTSRVQ